MQDRIEVSGGTVPGADVPEWLQWVWNAWHRLTLDRPWRGGGFGPGIPGAIPWTLCRDWCLHHGFSGDDVDFLDRCLREMDVEYRAWLEQQQKKPA